MPTDTLEGRMTGIKNAVDIVALRLAEGSNAREMGEAILPQFTTKQLLQAATQQLVGLLVDLEEMERP